MGRGGRGAEESVDGRVVLASTLCRISRKLTGILCWICQPDCVPRLRPLQRGQGVSCGQACCKPAEAVVLQHGRDRAWAEGSRQAQQHPRAQLKALLLPALRPKRCGLPLRCLLHTTEGNATLPSRCFVRDSGLVLLAQDVCASCCLGSQTEHLLGSVAVCGFMCRCCLLHGMASPSQGLRLFSLSAPLKARPLGSSPLPSCLLSFSAA